MRPPTPLPTLPALLLLAAAAAGCAAPDVAGKWRGPSAGVDALVRRAEIALYEERVGAALEAARAAQALDPASPDALRMLQAARTAAGDDGAVREEAERAVEERPSDPVALFLLARTETDPRRSRDLLDGALDLDPAFLWARLGRAQLFLGGGAERAALEDLRLAEETAPGHPWVPLLLAHAATRHNRPAEAVEHLQEAVRRDPASYRAREALARQLLRVPGRESGATEQIREAFALAPRARAAASAWRESLEREASPEDLRAAVAAVDGAEAAGGPLTPQARHLRGAARLLLGEAEAALPDLRGALEALEDRTAVLDDLRLALLSLGRYGEALDTEEGVTPPGVLDDPASETRDLRGAFRGEAPAAAAGDAAALARLTDLCRRLGWIREAALLAARRVALSPEDPGALRDAAETASTLRFLDEFRALWKGAYHGYAAGGDGGDTERALQALREMSVRLLGVDLADGIARREYAFLGEMAESVRATGPCAEWFRGHGLALVLGRPAGEPVEARLLRVVSLRRDREEAVLGRRFPVTIVVGEGLLVPSRREAGGAVLGGATVGDLVFVDLEGVARWSGASVRARRDPEIRPVLEAVRPLPADGAAEETSLRAPGRVTERVALSVEAWSDPRRALSDFFDAACRHELAHAADAERYLPVLGHPFLGLALLLRGRLSGDGVAAVLEGDAEIAAVAESREPRAALATMASFLPARDSTPPHSRGYYEALQDLVEVLRERGAVEPGRNIARELDRVDPAVLRSAAREVCRRRGLRAE